MTWLYLSLESAIGFACLSLLSRVVSVDSKNPRALSIAFNLIAILMTLIIFVSSSSYKSFTLPKGFFPYFYLFLACLFFGLYERLRFYVAKSIEVSLLAIISNISVVIAFIIALFIYGEPVTINKILGFLLIIISLFLISVDKVKKIKWKGISLAILANIFLGIGWALDKKGIYYFNSGTYNVLVWLLPLTVLCFPYVKFADIKKEIKISSWKIVLLSFINVTAYFINLKAQTLAEATRVIPVVQTSTVIAVIFGIFLLNEKNNLFKKILAGIIAVAGVFLLR